MSASYYNVRALLYRMPVLCIKYELTCDVLTQVRFCGKAALKT